MSSDSIPIACIIFFPNLQLSKKKEYCKINKCCAFHFQNAINEKESKKKIRQRGEKDRKSDKEKREREMAKFKAEVRENKICFIGNLPTVRSLRGSGGLDPFKDYMCSPFRFTQNTFLTIT